MRIIAIAILMGLAATTVQAEAARKPESETDFAVFAGGCFWCMEPPFDKTDGVLATISGYIGGSEEDANYQRVSSGRTGHYEAVRIEYDPGESRLRRAARSFLAQRRPLRSQRPILR